MKTIEFSIEKREQIIDRLIAKNPDATIADLKEHEREYDHMVLVERAEALIHRLKQRYKNPITNP